MEILTNRMTDITTIRRSIRERYALASVAALALLLTPAGFGQAPAGSGQSKEAPAAAPAATPPASKDFFIHAFHAKQLGTLECSLCHTPEKEGSVVLKRPGHDQCKVCHADDFDKDIKQIICAQCHSEFPPSGAADLLPFPRYKSTRAILFKFSHHEHVDPEARINPKTGFRADCTFCHTFDAQGIFAKFPSHAQCAACHSKPGMTPKLDASLDAAGCRGCHTPEEIENPGFTEQRRMIAKIVVSGKYVDIKFSHIAHFNQKDRLSLQCTTCHYAVPESTSLTNLTLPQMIDCVQCHDSSRVAAQFRMSDCKTCHEDTTKGLFTPVSHTRGVKPAFHTESFRLHHEEAASEPNAKCFVCHQNVVPAAGVKEQCVSCHIVMRPASHTARWKDDIHGQYVELDKTTCATCHDSDYCSRCHNELPRSHIPLPIFKAGAHAYQAMLNTSACFTCHTFQNTCIECHTQGLTNAAKAKAK